MVTVLSHSIVSPLGFTTQANLEAVLGMKTGLRESHGIVASLFTDGQNAEIQTDGLSRFEALAYRSAADAVAEAAIDAASQRTLFVLSTTKGNVAGLGTGDRIVPSDSAELIARRLGISTEPIVVDNACVSGLSAIVLASRLIEMGFYDTAIVCGAECQSRFIVSGFQSLKAMSARECRPFDIERTGLNLGEAAATVVLSRGGTQKGQWHIASAASANDAYNLTAPSRSGDGALMAIEKAMADHDADELALVCAHGTATLFNDQMESVAISRAGLGRVPVVGLKGYYGHTMGACGVIETILSMAAVDRGVVPSTRGFSELGVSGHINVTATATATSKHSVLKMLSGFGGTNVALLATKDDVADKATVPAKLRQTHHVSISPTEAILDGHKLSTTASGRALITELYKTHLPDYPRFYKMDLMCRIGVVATELLLQAEGSSDEEHPMDRAVVILGRTGSLHADMAYLPTIAEGNYYPSPERFIYTLPNIVAGEIAIRHHYHAETIYCSLPRRNALVESQICQSVFTDEAVGSAIFGWLDCQGDDQFSAELSITNRI